MSRGTSRTKIVDAVLAGMQRTAEGGAPYAVAESLVLHAQPCRVDVGLVGEAAAGSRGRARIAYEVRVSGLTGGLRATVATAPDAKPASVSAGLKLLREATRRRSEPGACRILALHLTGKATDAVLERLREAVSAELGSRAARTAVVAGEAVERNGVPVMPVAVVVAPAQA